MDDFLLYMKSHPLYDVFEQQLLSHRPVIPSYRHTPDNTEKWKAESMKQQGFDLCLELFKIGVEK